jgi:hypothetical protein
MNRIFYFGRLEINREPSKRVKQFIENLAEWDLRDNVELFHTSPSRKDIPDRELRDMIDSVFAPEGLILNGTIFWESSRDDRGKIVVRGNEVTVYVAEVIYKDCHGRTESETERQACAG